MLSGQMLSGIFGTLLFATPVLALSAPQLRQIGLDYRQQGQYPEAIAAFQQAVNLAPTDLSGRVSLGWTEHLAGQDQAAAKTLEATLQRDPFHVPALNALGIVYLVNDDLLLAATTHSWAALLAPDNEIAYYNLSLAWQRLDQPAWAIAAAQTAIKLEPDNPHPLVALAIAQFSIAQASAPASDDSSAAQQTYRQTYQQAITLDGRYSDSAFLDGLDQAGFSLDQIALAKQVLAKSAAN